MEANELLNTEQKNVMINLLAQFSDLFSDHPGLSKYEPIKIVTHDIVQGS